MGMRRDDFWNLSVYEWFLALEGWLIEKGYATIEEKQKPFVNKKERKYLESLIEQYG